MLLSDRKAKFPALSGKIGGIGEALIVNTIWVSKNYTKTDGLVVIPQVVDHRMYRLCLNMGFDLVKRTERHDRSEKYEYSLENTVAEADMRLEAWGLK